VIGRTPLQATSRRFTPAGAAFADAAYWMSSMSQPETISGVGRLHCGHRTLGCVGYTLHPIAAGHAMLVELDPMPDGARGDVFHLNLEDGRILERQTLEDGKHCAVLGDGPHPERRHQRRPPPSARAFA
jgi:hypothetical protein